MRLFTFCSYLITKESYNWWIIMRKWEFRHQISEAKKSKNVGCKYLEALRRISQACKMDAKFCKLKDTISQPTTDFAANLHACEILLSASRYLRSTFLDFLL